MLSIITESFGLHLIDAMHLTDAKNLYQLIQKNHALAIEHLASRLVALRIELFPSYMSEGIHENENTCLPLLGKSYGTSVSPWIVTLKALESIAKNMKT
jgi:hypothetical protein